MLGCKTRCILRHNNSWRVALLVLHPSIGYEVDKQQNHQLLTKTTTTWLHRDTDTNTQTNSVRAPYKPIRSKTSTKQKARPIPPSPPSRTRYTYLIEIEHSPKWAPILAPHRFASLLPSPPPTLTRCTRNSCIDSGFFVIHAGRRRHA